MLVQKGSQFQKEELIPRPEGKIAEQSDSILWKSFKSGSESSFIYIYENFFEKLYGYGCRLTDREDLVKDAIQDLFMDLRKNRENLGETDSIKFYLFKCLKRKILKELNSWFYKKEQFTGDLSFEITFSHEQVLIQRQLDEEKSAQLNKAIRGLSFRKREAIYYLYYEGLNYEQIKEIMNLSHVKSARNLIYKALDILRKSIG